MAPFITRISSLGSGFGKNTTRPTYAVTASPTLVNEGGSVTFTIDTTKVQDGTILYYTLTTIAGTITSSDFSTPLTGSFTVNGLTASVVLTLSADQTTEGSEQFKFNVHTDSTSGPIVAQSVTIVVNDTSIQPAYISSYVFKTGRAYNEPSQSDWTVPTDTTHIWVRSSGAGGQGDNFPNGYTGGNGGAGGFTQGVISVTAGETLKVAVGKENNNGAGPDIYARGGGFSGILRGPTIPGDVAPNFTSLLIAAGGGGGQVNTNYPPYAGPGQGGAAGGNYGEPGASNPYPVPKSPATGGRPNQGGSGSYQHPQIIPAASNGSYLQGGAGGSGGGGGGYYGGGGDGTSYQGGGAGGSGYAGGAISNGATYGGSARAVSPQMFTPDYPLLGPNPLSPNPWGYGAAGGETNNRDNGKGNGYVIIHCFRRAPSASDLPGTFTVTATY